MNLIRELGGCKTLVDFQWRFAIATENSRTAGQSECFIQCKFVLRNNHGIDSQLQLDLNMAEFNEFFHEMDKINNMIEIIN